MRGLRSKTRAERRIGLARALSKQGVCSRSAATQLIIGGRVRLDGHVVRDPEAPTTSTSHIEVDGAVLEHAEPLYLMLNKPRGLVTTARDEHDRATVYQCFQDTALPWIAPVGRLDQASEGLLLFTNDSAWASAILEPARHVTKTYHVQVEGIPDATTLRRLTTGVIVADGEHLSVSRVTLLRHGARNAWLEVLLTEGKNRQIRRLLEAVGLGVTRLVRVALGPLELGFLAKGEWRALTAAEVRELSNASGVANLST